MSENPFTARQARAGIGAAGRRAEKKTSTRLGGRLTPASGALAGAKGDFTTQEFLCENKATEAASMSLKLDWLQKITREALPKGKTPALTVQFVDSEGRPVKAGSWVLIPEHLFKELLDGRD